MSDEPDPRVGTTRVRQTKREGEPATWVETDLDNDWRAALRMTVQDGLPVVAEVRVYPIEPRAPAGSWSGHRVPRGGLTARLLRGVHVDAARDHFETMRSRGLLLGAPAITPDLERLRAGAMRRPGRRGLDHSFLAAFAAAYLSKLQTGARNPTDALAHDLNLDPNRVRTLLRAARTRGLLTPPPRGRAGGGLTAAGRAALTTWETP